MHFQKHPFLDLSEPSKVLHVEGPTYDQTGGSAVDPPKVSDAARWKQPQSAARTKN